MLNILQAKKSGINAEIRLPSSKSISNRLLIMSALSGNQMKVKNLSESDDTRIMQELLSSESKEKDAGHAGTAMRFLTAYYSLQDETEVILTGSERMKNRPIAELVLCLRELGASINYLDKPGYPPLLIRGANLQGRKIRIDSGISSQYISALMMIGPLLEGGLEIILTGNTISSSYINLTAGLMRKAGIKIDWKGKSIIINEGDYREGTIYVEPDWSAASYWFSVTGLAPESQIYLRGLTPDSLQGDSALVEIFEGLGVKSTFDGDGLLLMNEELTKKEFNFDFKNNPDLVQTLAPYCVAKSIPFNFSGCRTLRIKETDRVQALYNELKKFDINLYFSPDGDKISWNGQNKPNWKRKAVIDTYKDHRMAMGIAPLSIMTGELRIKDPEVVTKSYPDFWMDLRKAGFRVVSAR